MNHAAFQQQDILRREAQNILEGKALSAPIMSCKFLVDVSLSNTRETGKHT